jgi:hypothetical protein
MLPLPSPGRALADGEWRTLARIAETLLEGSAIERGDAAVPPEDVADNVEAFLIRGRSKRAWRIRALLHVVEWTPLLRGERPLSRMTPSRRRRLVVERYIDGRGVWGICAKIRYIVLMGAYGDARLHAPTSYVPVSRRGRFAQSRHDRVTAVAP